MTEEEVLQALPGRAVRLDPAETLVDGRVVSVEIEHLDLAGVDFRVRFVFSRGRLALASLKNSPARLATTDDYDRLHGLLVARLSGPGAEARDESVIDYRQARWDAPGERVDLKYIPGQLVIQHGPPASSGAATPVGSGP